MKEFADRWGLEIVLASIGVALAVVAPEMFKGVVWAFFFPLVFKLVMKMLRRST